MFLSACEIVLQVMSREHQLFMWFVSEWNMVFFFFKTYI